MLPEGFVEISPCSPSVCLSIYLPAYLAIDVCISTFLPQRARAAPVLRGFWSLGRAKKQWEPSAWANGKAHSPCKCCKAHPNLVNAILELPLPRVQWLAGRYSDDRRANFCAHVEDALEDMTESGYDLWHDRYQDDCKAGVTYFLEVGNPILCLIKKLLALPDNNCA